MSTAERAETDGDAAVGSASSIANMAQKSFFTGMLLTLF
jgi:hypothetical protein